MEPARPILVTCGWDRLLCGALAAALSNYGWRVVTSRTEASEAGACNCVLLKPNQRGTLTETLDTRRAAERVGYATIVSARSGETEDTTIAHLSVGWGAGQLKVGSFARGERMAKWNEMLRIEEALGGKARFAGGSVLGRTK